MRFAKGGTLRAGEGVSWEGHRRVTGNPAIVFRPRGDKICDFLVHPN
jgi:hypothetical protein